MSLNLRGKYPHGVHPERFATIMKIMEACRNRFRAHEILKVVDPKWYYRVKPSTLSRVLREASRILQIPTARKHRMQITEQFKLLPHQIDALDFLTSKKNSGFLFMEMGTGKTRVALVYSLVKNCNRVLVVCPKSVALSWLTEVEKLQKYGFPSQAVDLTQMAMSDRIFTLVNAELAGVYIVNYETFLKHSAQLHPQFDLVIFDESYYLKNSKAQRTKKCAYIFRHVQQKLLLSGAPYFDTPQDLFGQFLVFNRKILGESFWRWRNLYFESDYMGWSWKLRKVGEKAIRALLAEHAFMVKLRDCVKLPRAIHETITVEQTAAQKKEFAHLKKLWRTTQGKELNYALQLISEMRKICAGFYMPATKPDEEIKPVLIATNKDEYLLELLHQQGNKPTVVWFVHNCALRRFAALFKKKIGEPYITFYGDASANKLKKFINGKVNYLFVQLAKGSVGLNLQRTELCVFYEQPFSWFVKVQAVKRCAERIGQKRSTLVIDLLTENSIEIHVARLLKRKKSFERYIRGLWKKSYKQVNNLLQ